MDTNIFLNNLGSNPLTGIKISLISLLKFPLIIIIFGNLLFAILLYFRSRILSDTFKSSQNSFVKIAVPVYLFASLLGSILAVLFLLIG
jgi:hypothetical protein